VVQILSLIQSLRRSVTLISILCASLDIANVIGVILLILVEHRRTIRPSSVLSLYLFASAVISSIHIRSALLRRQGLSVPRLLSAVIVLDLGLLALESWPRSLYLKDAEKYSPEELAGLFSRGIFWWVNLLLRLGSHKILKIDDLYPLNQAFLSQGINQRISRIWGRC